MRKAWVFLIVLAVVALSVPVFADEAAMAPGPTVKFSMLGFWWLNVDPNLSGGLTGETTNSGSQRVWPTMDVTFNADNNFLGYGLAVGIGPVILHWVNDFSLQNTLVGAEASMMGFGAFVSYG